MKYLQKIPVLMAVLCLPVLLQAQDNMGVISPFTTLAYRSQFSDALVKWSILKNLAAPLNNDDDEYDFQSSFWPMELIHYKTDYVEERLVYAFTKAPQRSARFQGRLVEIVYTNWPSEFRRQVAQLMQATRDPKVFAACAVYLWRDNSDPRLKGAINALMQQKFDTLREKSVLMMLRQKINDTAAASLPPLNDLFREQFAPGLTVLYSFQRNDRDYPGLALVRKPNGDFVRDTAGKPFAVPQLARSITNLPFFLTNGNTPQGIYRMSGFDVSRSRFIGPTENIQLSLPYEIPVDSFLITPAPGDTLWTIDKYRNLLPASWQQYTPIYNAYYAGDAGRTAIIAHGTTIDPEYYRGKIYYPQTPSQGCLCTHESWSPENGQRLASDQQKLVDAVKEAGNGVGYAVVINLDDKKAPVTLQDVLPFMVN